MDNKVRRGISGGEVYIGEELGDNSKFIVVDRNFEGYGVGGSVEDYGDSVTFCRDKEELFNYLLRDKLHFYVEKLQERGEEVEYVGYTIDEVLVNKSMEEKRELLIKVMDEVGEDRDKDGVVWNMTYIIEFE